MSNGVLCSITSCDSSVARRAAMHYSWGNIVLHDGEGVFQTPAAGGNCSGDGSGAGSGPVDVVGTGAGGGGAAVMTGGIVDGAGAAAVT